MANITPEINAFQSAVYGEDVRTAMVSLANKVNNEASNVGTFNSRLQALEGDGAITTSKLADGAVTNVKLADGSVTNVKLADGSVTRSKLGNDIEITPPDGSISTAKLADGSVTDAKLAQSGGVLDTVSKCEYYIYGGGTGNIVANEYYNSTSGNIVSSEGWARTGKFEISDGSTYIFVNQSGGYKLWNAVCFNSSGNVLGSMDILSNSVSTQSIKGTYSTTRKIGINFWTGSPHAALTHDDIKDWAIADENKSMAGMRLEISSLDNSVNRVEADVESIKNFESTYLQPTNFVVDHYIINNTSGAFMTNPNGILSGYIPISLSYGTLSIKMDTLHIGDVAFYDSSKSPLFAFNINNSGNGYRAYGLNKEVWHGGSNDYVTFSGNDQDMTIKAKSSNVAYVVFYIASVKVTTSDKDYYGAHEDLTNVPISEIDLFYSTILQTTILDLEKQVTDLEAQVDSMSGVEGSSLVMLNKSGTTIDVRSNFTPSLDIAIKFEVRSSNNVFNMVEYYTLASGSADNVVSGTQFKSAYDDITGVKMNNTNVGGNHGNDHGYKITFGSSHGLTESNIGETWKIDGNDFVIICIPSTTEIWGGFPANNNNGLNRISITNYSMTRNSVTKSFSSYAGQQLVPAINHQTVEIYNDKGNKITDNGTYKGAFFDIVNSYDVISTAAMIAYLKTNVGSNTNSSYYSESISESFYTMNLVFHCRERGSITVFESVGFNRNGSLEFIHGLQSQTVNSSNYWSVPGTTFDDITLIPNEIQQLTTDTWNDANHPPIRYYQYVNSDASGNGMVIGFNNRYADGLDSLRKNVYSAGFIYETHKMHPYFYSYQSPTTVTNESSISMVGFRCPLTTYDNDIPSVAWYYVGDDIYLMIDAHASVNKYMTLPNVFNGRTVELVEFHGDISLSEVVAGSKVKVVVKNGYGSGTYKLSRQ